MRYSSIRVFCVTGVLASGLVAFVAGQSQQEPPEKPQDPAQRPPTFRVEANFVRVDAYPLKDGKPVLDLKAQQFEVFEDGVAQKIETFEHVVVRPAGPQGERVEPSSQRESLQAAANPRNRVFVIFLDTPHVMVDSAHAINEPLIRLIDSILGPDDLVGVMTPEMAASQIVLGRKTQVIADSLRKNWPWGTRFTYHRDEREAAYDACYPKHAGVEERTELGSGERAHCPQTRTRHPRGARGSRPLPPHDPRGTQGDPYRHRRVAALRRESVPHETADQSGDWDSRGDTRRRPSRRWPERQADDQAGAQHVGRCAHPE